MLDLQIESLLDLRIAIVRIFDTMSDRSGIFVNLIVVSSLERLVAEEVNGLVIDTPGKILVVLDVLQAVPLIPPRGENVEGDLATN